MASPRIQKTSRAAFTVPAAPTLPFANDEIGLLTGLPIRSRTPRNSALAPSYMRRSPWMLAGIIAGHVLLLVNLTETPSTRVATHPKILTVQLIAPETPPEPFPKAAPVLKPSRPIKPPSRVIATDAATTRIISPSEPVSELTEAIPTVPTEADQPVTHAPTPTAEVAPQSVVPPRFNADYLDNPKPPYPMSSQRLREEGEVRLRVWVDADGAATRVAIFRSSGFDRLDRIALETVQRWRFTPARQGDQTVAAQVLVPITFNLKD